MRGQLPASGFRLPARRRLTGVAILTLLALGCFRGSPSERPPIHLNPNMDDQPKYLPQSESAFFANGATMRPAVPGTVARGELREDEGYFRGMIGEAPIATIPLERSDTVLRRGEQRYDIFCGPCHGELGDGKGMLFLRSQVQSADLTDPRIVEMPAGQIYDVITRGFGLMPAYAHQIPVEDRWAIVAHVRTLQETEAVFGGRESEPTLAEPVAAAPAAEVEGVATEAPAEPASGEGG